MPSKLHYLQLFIINQQRNIDTCSNAEIIYVTFFRQHSSTKRRVYAVN